MEVCASTTNSILMWSLTLWWVGSDFLAAIYRGQGIRPESVSCQSPLSMGFPKQEYWGRLPFPTPGDLPDPEIEPASPSLAVGFFTTEPPVNPWSDQWRPHISSAFFPSLPPCLFPLILSDLEMHLPASVKCVIISALLPFPFSGEFRLRQILWSLVDPRGCGQV